MQKPKLLIYSKGHSDHLCCQNIFGVEFFTEVTGNTKQFRDKITHDKPDVAVACFCFANRDDAEEIMQLQSIVSPLPLLACAKNLSLDFVSAAAQVGTSRFLCCNWNSEKIKEIVFETVKHGGIRKYLETGFPNNYVHSYHTYKIIDEIIHAFPLRINETQIAKRIGISVSWLQKIFRSTFNLTYHRLLRRIWIDQALYLMKYTNMDNTEIAIKLNYSEESSMARDFRKELGLNPTEARKLLTNQEPETLLQSPL